MTAIPLTGLAHSQGGVDGHRPASRFDHWRAGQRVKVHVIRRLDAYRYDVRLGTERHVVDSRIALPIGESIEATVVSAGDRLELRYSMNGSAFGIDASGAAEGADEGQQPAGDDVLAGLAAAYRLSLPSNEALVLRGAVALATNAAAMAKSGLFLARLGVPLANPALRALHDRQAGAEDLPDEVPMSPADLGGASGMDGAGDLATFLQAAIPEASTPSAPLPSFDFDDSDDNPSKRRALASWLLNLQDGGRVNYRYGALPLLVGGQLMEIDMALFQERKSAELPNAERRFVLTLRTESLGTVRIAAKANGDRLLVEFASDSKDGLQRLVGQEAVFSGLLSDLGWKVDALSFREAEAVPNASSDVVEHVLRAGSLDQRL